MKVSETASFERVADHYARKDLTGYCSIARKLRLDRSLKNVPKPIASLLEVGCGAGFSARYLRGKYSHYTGLDSSESLIALAVKHNNGSQNAIFLCRDAEKLDLGGKFDLIVMIGVLHHILRPDKVLEGLKTCLSPDGLLVVNEPGRGNPLVSLLRRIRKKIDPRYAEDQLELSWDKIRVLFASSGYRTEIFSQGLFSTPLAETLILPALIGMPLTLAAKWVDPLLQDLLPSWMLRRLAWNIVVEARLPAHE